MKRVLARGRVAERVVNNCADDARPTHQISLAVLSRISREPSRPSRPAVRTQISPSGQRGLTSKAYDRLAVATPETSRIAAAIAIIAPLSVHSCSSG
jgi:hypothetical protein